MPPADRYDVGTTAYDLPVETELKTRSPGKSVDTIIRNSCPYGVRQTFRSIAVMSALPPKADIAGRQLDVRFVPKADIRSRDLAILRFAGWAGTGVNFARGWLRI
jgi:hypothetical protein